MTNVAVFLREAAVSCPSLLRLVWTTLMKSSKAPRACLMFFWVSVAARRVLALSSGAVNFALRSLLTDRAWTSSIISLIIPCWSNRPSWKGASCAATTSVR